MRFVIVLFTLTLAAAYFLFNRIQKNDRLRAKWQNNRRYRSAIHYLLTLPLPIAMIYWVFGAAWGNVFLAIAIILCSCYLLFRRIQENDRLHAKWQNSRRYRLMIHYLPILPLSLFFILWILQSPWEIVIKDPGPSAFLYGGLDGREIDLISARLDRLRFRYQISPDSTRILVNRREHQEVALKLAREGLPSRGHVLFEEGDLEWELERMMKGFEGIQSARVQIMQPTGGESTLRATVNLDLDENAALAREDSATIVHLVGSSVPELEKKHVAVLTRYYGTDDAVALMQDPHWQERDLEKKVRNALSDHIDPERFKVNITLFTEGEQKALDPFTRNRSISVALSLDQSDLAYDPETHRYNTKPIPAETVAALAQRAREAAVFDETRGDRMDIFRLDFDKSEEIQQQWDPESEARKIRVTSIAILLAKSLIGLGAIITFHLVLKAMQRRAFLME